MNFYTAVLNTNKAPTNHASMDRVYGGASIDIYGHVKLSNEYATPIGGAIESTAASQHALYNAYWHFTSQLQTIKSRFYGTIIIDSSDTKHGHSYQLAADNTYIITASRGTHENEVAVFVVNARNNMCVVTTLKSVTGITFVTSGLIIGIYADVGIVAELTCVRIS